ncbi:hypothetical protein ACHQM5_030722 [Ranunculus cassubicifolius]
MEREKMEFMVVLIDTNLDTHIALSLHPHTTAGDLKCIIEKEHPGAFPDVGAITVDAIKVKRRKVFFHLSELVPVESAFVGLAKKNWSLYVDATVCSNQPEKLKEEVDSVRDVADSLKVENHEDNQGNLSTKSSEKMETCYPKEVIDGNSKSEHCVMSKEEGVHRISTPLIPMSELAQKMCSPGNVADGNNRSEHCTTSKEEGVHGISTPVTPKSEVAQKMCSLEKVVYVHKEEEPLRISPPAAPAASVTGLITRYFPSEYDEVNSRHSPSESHASCEGWSPPKLARKPSKSNAPRHVGPNKLKARSSKSQVGNRVLEAGKCIGNWGSKKKSPVAALCQSKRHRLLAGNPRTIAFEISDSV